MSAAPLCFVDPRVFKLWSESPSAADCASSGPCTDCLPTYQAKMKRQGRCVHPETRWGLYPEGGLFGFWRRRAKPGPKPAAKKPVVSATSHQDEFEKARARYQAMRERMEFGR